jgi:hypothetical protein
MEKKFFHNNLYRLDSKLKYLLLRNKQFQKLDFIYFIIKFPYLK